MKSWEVEKKEGFPSLINFSAVKCLKLAGKATLNDADVDTSIYK
jgi:hypothetical protein